MGYGKLGPAVRWPTEVLRMKDLNLFFSDLSEPYREIFADCEHVWEPLTTLGPRLKQMMRKKAQSVSHISHLPGVRTTLDSASYHRGEQGLYVQDWIDLDARVLRGRRERIIAHDRDQNLGHRATRKRELTGDHFVEDDPHGEQITARIHAIATRLLRAHVMRRPDDRALLGQWPSFGLRASQVRDPEVEDFNKILLRARALDHQVIGLEIAVNDALMMHRVQPPRHLFDQGNCLFHTRRSLG